LQDYYMQYGLYDSKFNETKVKKPKAVPLGPTVILDAERCILCSRCVRFCDEVTKTGELGIFNRGDLAELNIYPGKTLDNKYSGNVVDICPVGALTDRDFRFKCRVWYLASQDSVCPGCSKGCNIQIHYNKERQWRPHIAGGDRVMRLKPRYNAGVNQWWMCDEGRYGYQFIDQNRLTAPQLRDNGRPRAASWEAALETIRNKFAHLQQAGALDQVGVVASTHLTNEELFIIRELFAETLGCQVTAEVPAKPGFSDDWLMQPDKSPNSRGARELGLIGGNGKHVTAAKLLDIARQGKLKVLYVFGYDLVELFGEPAVKEATSKLEMLVFQGSNLNDTCVYAHVTLPSATYAEKDGTFTNVDGRVQRIRPAFPPLGQSRIDWDILEDLSNKLNIPTPYQSAAEILQALGKAVPAFKGMTYEKIGSGGMVLNS
ncbi:MAG: molybdopterin-dependent oxidoreductase, partial [Candidatus Omnitrophica bacterium]|nr:molybdopterin-dependent oxidoreductase [Candidatus Omnitrophota bacterium]